MSDHYQYVDTYHKSSYSDGKSVQYKEHEYAQNLTTLAGNWLVPTNTDAEELLAVACPKP